MSTLASAEQGVSLTAAIEEVVARGLWCTVEVRDRATRRSWEPALVICERSPEPVVSALIGWIRDVPGRDARLGACRRDTLAAMPDAGPLCYRAGSGPTPLLAEAAAGLGAC